MKNFFIKLLSVTLACFLWISIVISNQNISEFKQGIPVTLVNLSEDQQLSTSLPKITVKIDAPIDVLNTLDISDFNATIDAKGFINWEFEKEVNLSIKNTKVRIVSFSPKNVIFSIEWFWKKTIPVKLNLTGKADPNYKILSAQIKERFVQISAANSILENTTELIIDYKLDWELNDIEKSIKPIIKDKNDNMLDVDFSPKLLNLSIKLDQIKLSKTVWINPVFIWDLPENYKISSVKVEPLFKKVSWDKAILLNLDLLNTEDINLWDLKIWKKIYSRNLIVPSGLHVKDLDRVRIIIDVDEIVTSDSKTQ